MVFINLLTKTDAFLLREYSSLSLETRATQRNCIQPMQGFGVRGSASGSM